MKRTIRYLLTGLMLVAMAGEAKAQYASFFADSTWSYDIAYGIVCYEEDYSPENLGGCVLTHEAFFSRSDTIIVNGMTYYRPCEECYVNQHYIREDTSTGRLYRYVPESQTEFLMCDMSLSLGDTFHLYDESYNYMYFTPLHQNGDYTVDSIAYINGRKVIYFRNLKDWWFNQPYNTSFRFMEGIGAIYGIGAIQVSTYENMPLLLCHHKNDTLYYMTHEDLQCYQFAAGVETYDSYAMRIYPNPAGSYVQVSFQESAVLDAGQLYLMDMSGRVLWQHPVTEESLVVNMSRFAPGVYTLLFQTDKGKIDKKLVKQ